MNHVRLEASENSGQRLARRLPRRSWRGPRISDRSRIGRAQSSLQGCSSGQVEPAKLQQLASGGPSRLLAVQADADLMMKNEEMKKMMKNMKVEEQL